VSLGSDEIRKALRAHNELAPESEAAKKAAGSLVAQPGDVVFFGGPPPLPPRTDWTRRVPHPVLIGHAASLTPCVCAFRGLPAAPAARRCTRAKR
jgi:hypothetical protein